MKILIIANYDLNFPKELMNNLNKFENELAILDFSTLTVYFNKIIEKQWANKLNKWKRLNKLIMIPRIFFIGKIIKALKYDIINIHYNRWFYLLINKTIKNTKTILSFYGSDFYRTKTIEKIISRIFYKNIKAFSFTNPVLKNDFIKYYRKYEDRCYICRFGLKTLDFIEKNNKSHEEIKRELGFSQNRILVTCGYNSTPAQRHSEIIEELLKLDKSILDKCQFIFPITYGNNINKERIKKILLNSKLNYIILEDYLIGQKNADIKIVSDIFINVLTTDSFSGSMLEYLFAENIVITGEWLPYELLNEKGVRYYKIKEISDLAKTLAYCINNYNIIKRDLLVNKKLILELASWSYNSEIWLQMFYEVRKRK